MIRSAAIPVLLALSATAAERPDLLRFTNGDQLHGTFVGIREGPHAVWQRDDLDAPVEFTTERLRHIVLRGGRPAKPLESLSHLGLVNGDRIPGTITAIDGDRITLDTACAGILHIPRQQVAIVSPNPLGGRVHYHGPFSADDWEMAHPAHPAGVPETTVETDTNGEEAEHPGKWEFSGSAWYWQHKTPGTALVRKSGMPDRAIVSFDLAWKNRLAVAIGFHADFAPPRAKEEKKGNKPRAFVPGDSSDLPRIFGNSYVLQMYSNYLMLFRTAVTDDGDVSLDRVQLNNNNLRLGETGNATVEIRSNRRSGAISLFIDGEFVAQWSEGEHSGRDGSGFAGKGSGIGFLVQGNDALVRISDIVISEWNGMPDSARSLQIDDQDVVLMTNGTDRYAGKVTTLDSGANVLFQGKHGSFRFPLADVAEIRFARNSLAEPSDPPADNMIVRLSPVGSISGRPVSGHASMIGIVSPVVGELNISLDPAVMLDFNSSNHFIDDWDADF